MAMVYLRLSVKIFVKSGQLSVNFMAAGKETWIYGIEGVDE
jgi:hypothetical protein